ncbi:hypothetical protein GWK47_030386 [Chionoecetes opilio]|uniref:Uncharacterized protein n=1 Tax=Chionoecetes opilio TaxID=41210 RepID=A0A8J5D578_CHIOP|nr:hypothetical protein GWK47_030386 [Chionoecetes opilio]
MAYRLTDVLNPPTSSAPSPLLWRLPHTSQQLQALGCHDYMTCGEEGDEDMASLNVPFATSLGTVASSGARKRMCPPVQPCWSRTTMVASLRREICFHVGGLSCALRDKLFAGCRPTAAVKCLWVVHQSLFDDCQLLHKV